MQAKIVKLIRDGNYIETACGACGIHESTYFNWLNRGEKSQSGQFFEFYKAVKNAECEAEALYLGIIRNAAQEGTWQAGAWFLERKHPDKWGRRDRHEITGKDGGPVIIVNWDTDAEDRD